MNKRTFFCAAFSLVLLSSVSCRRAEAAAPSEVAARAAKAYYDYLIQGKYESYVDGFYRPDSIPGSYREQLVVNAKMYAWQLKEDHRGLVSVDIAGARADTARHSGHAFLVLCFADSTKEEIVVPMVLHKNVWMLK